MRWLIEEPDAFPFIEDLREIVGGVEKLVRAPLRVARVCRYEATR
jgi:hypothetical protein